MNKTVPLAGWLFADLLLGLAMLFITSMIGVQLPLSADSPTATWTPTATSTWTPTRSSTVTPLPPGVPSPTPTYTPLPTPTPSSGMNPVAYTLKLQVNPNLLAGYFANIESSKAQVREQMRTQIAECFKDYNDGRARAGLVLSFGVNPLPERGEQLAREASNILAANFPAIVPVDNSILRNFHTIQKNAPAENGNVNMEVYFIRGPQLTDPISQGRTMCLPPSSQWCLGSGTVQIKVFNWQENETLRLTLNQNVYEIGSAKGDNPVYQCIKAFPGARWTLAYGNTSISGNLSNDSEQSFHVCRNRNELNTRCSGSVSDVTSGN